jgi:hypothetical protein
MRKGKRDMITDKQWRECLELGRARAIFRRLDDDSISDKDKLLAIRMVANMPTHNGTRKTEILTALRWILDKMPQPTLRTTREETT